MAEPLGTIFAEITLDRSKFDKGLQEAMDRADKAGVTIANAWKTLGSKSNQSFDDLRAKAVKAFEAISKAGVYSAEEVARAQMLAKAQIKSLLEQQYVDQLKHWENVGLRSTSMIKAQIEQVKASAEAIKATVAKGSQDWINIERKKNANLKELQKEMVGQHDMSMAAMARAVLRAYAAYFVLKSAVQGLFNFISKGIKAIDDMKVSTVAVAAQITSMQGTTGNVVENYRKNLAYAQALVPVLQQIDASSFANLSQIQRMNMAMTNQGVILDVNNKKQLESFTALTNAVALFTQGQDKERQASQEIRSLMTGQVRAGDMVAMQMDALVKKQGIYKGGLRELVKEGKKHGDTLERMQPYLVGIIAASGDIQQTWEAVGTSIETAWNIIQRALFKDIYKDVTISGQKFAQWMKDNSDEIVNKIQSIGSAIKFAVEAAIASFTLMWGAFKATTIKIGSAWLSFVGIWSTTISAMKAQWGLLNADMATQWKVTTNSISMLWQNKMALIGGVLSAAFTGFSIGQYLSDQFEWARIAGVAMVYGVINAWEQFIYRIKVGWERLKQVKDSLLAADPGGFRASVEGTNPRIKILEEEYKKEKALRDKQRDEQFDSVTDKALAEAKRKALESAKVKTPDIGGFGEDTDSLIARNKIAYEALKDINKSYFKEQEDNIDLMAYRLKAQHMNELEITKRVLDAKDQLNSEFYEKTMIEIEAEAKARTQKNRSLVSDAEFITEKEKGLLADVAAKANAVYNDRIKLSIDTATKIEEINGKMEIDANKNSKEAMDYQISLIRQRAKEMTIAGANEVKVQEWANFEISKVRVAAYERDNKAFFDNQRAVFDAYTEMAAKQDELAMNQNQRHISNLRARQVKELELVERALQVWIIGDIEAKNRREIINKNYTQAIDEQLSKELNQQASFYSTLEGYEEEYRRKKIDWIDKERKVLAKALGDEVAANKWAIQEEGKLDQEIFERKSKLVSNALGNMVSTFQNLSSMYDKSSSEYARMQEAAKAMIVLQQAVAVANAVATIANQGLGDPYTAFARVAAMAAAMGSLLASAGIGFGGSVSQPPLLPPSTVFGAAPGTASESVKNSYKILQDTYDLQRRELVGIHDSMKELNTNITNVVRGIIQSELSGMPFSATGVFQPFGADFGSSLGSGILGKIGAINVDINKKIFGNWLGGITESIAGGMFGSTETYPTASGLQIGRSGRLVRPYTTVHEEEKGALFGLIGGGSRDYDVYGAVNRDLIALFSGPHGIYPTLKSSVLEMAQELGGDINKATTYIFEEMKINLSGKNTEEIAQVIQDKISEISDKMAEEVLGGIIPLYSQLGEGALETATRLYRDKIIVEDILDMIGGQGVNNIIEVAESLIDLADGLDNLQAAASSYYDKFFTESDKQNRLETNLKNTLLDLNEVLPATREGYKELVEAQKLNTESGRKTYVTLISLADSADKYYTALGDVLDVQDNMTESLLKQHRVITQWLAELNTSALAPTQSMEAVRFEYNRLKALAFLPNAEESAVSDYLGYAKEFLTFMRAYGGNYQDIYDQVVRDAISLRDHIDAQIGIENQQLQVLLSIERNTAAIAGLPTHASGGYASKMSIFGENGGEWAVPTYEPYRGRFLKNAPSAFWKNLGMDEPSNEEITITIPVNLDGNKIAESVARYVPRNANLASAIKRVH